MDRQREMNLPSLSLKTASSVCETKRSASITLDGRHIPDSKEEGWRRPLIDVGLEPGNDHTETIANNTTDRSEVVWAHNSIHHHPSPPCRIANKDLLAEGVQNANKFVLEMKCLCAALRIAYDTFQRHVSHNHARTLHGLGHLQLLVVSECRRRRHGARFLASKLMTRQQRRLLDAFLPQFSARILLTIANKPSSATSTKTKANDRENFPHDPFADLALYRRTVL